MAGSCSGPERRITASSPKTTSTGAGRYGFAFADVASVAKVGIDAGEKVRLAFRLTFFVAALALLLQHDDRGESLRQRFLRGLCLPGQGRAAAGEEGENGGEDEGDGAMGRWGDGVSSPNASPARTPVDHGNALPDLIAPD